MVRNPYFRKAGEHAIIHALILLVLLSGLVGGVSPATAGPGDFNVTVGGITTTNKSQQGLGSRIDKPQTGLGSFSVPDTTRRLDGLPGNGLPGSGGGSLVPDTSPVPDTKSSTGGTTLPSSQGGTFSLPGSTNLGQQGGQFCSSNDVTVGENTQSRLHCSNTVNIPAKP